MKEIISLAPGRTCLFGDHQDYMHLPIIACAINRQITLKAVENNSEAFHISMPDEEQERTISINTWSKDFEAKGDNFIAALKVLKSYFERASLSNYPERDVQLKQINKLMRF